MIKKFKEFNELNFTWWSEKLKNFNKNGLYEEEVEDQFLRIKEVFDCDVEITTVETTEPLRLKFSNKSYIIDITAKCPIRRIDNFEFYIDRVSKELDKIKYRIENMFPVKMTQYLDEDRYLKKNKRNRRDFFGPTEPNTDTDCNTWGAHFKYIIEEKGELITHIEWNIEIK